jgi:hypothetical protein
MKILFTLMTLMSAVPAFAMQLRGVEMMDDIKVAGRTLQLNGMGVREATIFNFPVYVGGLYLEKPSHNPDAILKSDELKRVQLHFVRDVSAKDIRNTWDTAFEKYAGNDLASLKIQLGELQAFITDMKKGESMGVIIWPDRIELMKSGRKIASVEVTKRFGEVLLASWLGPEPPNEELKVGMLGLSR